MTNDQMKANRFANFAKYRRFVKMVRTNVTAGKTVNVVAGWTILKFAKPASLECLKATMSGVYVQRGKSWVCIMDRAVAPSKVYAS